jgi:transmembrane sensor
MIRPALTWAEIEAMAPEEAAALWLVRFDGGASAGDRDLFERWLNADAAHARAWSAAQAGWNLLDLENEAAFADLLEEARAAGLPPTRHRSWTRYAGVAAALAVGALAWELPGVWRDHIAPLPAAEAAASGFRYATAVGQTRSVRLADGSIVTLDTASRIEGRFTARGRDLRLVAGQAYFDVAHDPVHPFRVAFQDQVVTALGTRFDVRIDPASAEVTLLQGHVVVQAAAPSDTRVDLSPGQAVVVDAQDYHVRAVDPERSAAWRTGSVHFENVPLPQALAEMSRYSDHPFLVRDPVVAALRISGVFQTGAPLTFLKDIAQLYRLKLEHLPSGGWELKPLGR